jgi:hypothetical protein
MIGAAIKSKYAMQFPERGKLAVDKWKERTSLPQLTKAGSML